MICIQESFWWNTWTSWNFNLFRKNCSGGNPKGLWFGDMLCLQYHIAIHYSHIWHICFFMHAILKVNVFVIKLFWNWCDRHICDTIRFSPKKIMSKPAHRVLKITFAFIVHQILVLFLDFPNCPYKINSFIASFAHRYSYTSEFLKLFYRHIRKKGKGYI